jgi:hypothetical protein
MRSRTRSSSELHANLETLPGFGKKVKSMAAVLAKRYGVKAAKELVPPHPTLGDVDSPQALIDYRLPRRCTRRSGAASAERQASSSPAKR